MGFMKKIIKRSESPSGLYSSEAKPEGDKLSS